MTTSFATLKPPSVCNDPSVVLVASVVSSVLSTPLNVPVVAARVVVVAAAAVPLPKTPSSVPVNPVPTTSPVTVKFLMPV